jgi:hypothetical protein
MAVLTMHTPSGETPHSLLYCFDAARLPAVSPSHLQRHELRHFITAPLLLTTGLLHHHHHSSVTTKTYENENAAPSYTQTGLADHQGA